VALQRGADAQKGLWVKKHQGWEARRSLGMRSLGC
jgi:hypothetical protein